MASVMELRAKAIGLVLGARERARRRRSQLWLDRRFGRDIEAEFESDPAAFYARYAPYLGRLNAGERGVLREPA